MKLRYEKSKGGRIKFGFWGVYVSPTCPSDALWYDEEQHKWLPADQCSAYGTSSTHHTGKGCPKTSRGFKNYIKRHPELAGREVIFLSPYVGHNVYAYPE